MRSTLRAAFGLRTVQKNFKRSAAIRSDSVNFTEEVANAKPFEEVPGPSSLPIIGQLHHFLPPFGDLSDLNTFVDVLYEKYGPLIRLEGLLSRPTMLFVYDPDTIAYVLRSENWMPIRPGFFSVEYYRKYHNKPKNQQPQTTGLITDHNEMWKDFRTKVNPVLLQPKTIKLYTSVLDQVALDMVERMKSLRNADNKIDKKLDIEMNLWALESIGVVALGGRLNCFDPNLAADSPERRLIECVHGTFKSANELDFKPSLWKYFPTRAFKRGMKLYEEQESLARYFVRRAIKDLENKQKDSEEKGVLEKLLEIDERVAIIMASDMLFAGVDTAANTVLAVLYHLATNPEKQQKLREEVTSRKESQPYLRACIKESLRLRPVVSGNLRKSTKEYVLMGYKIPKGMFIVFAHEFLSTLESQYPRAKEYIPERWIEKDNPLYHSSAHPFAYSPFGFGVRSCIGRRIAELEIQTFVARLVENFRVEWSGPPPQIERNSLNYMKGPFNFTFNDV